ncbi:MAG: hypothetical protein FVQ80_14350 [Planctomycetes bacterium]|nr:hypothetical protein [Planctomycetota bacterium]
MSNFELQRFLSTYYVYLLEFNFFFLIIAVILNYKYIEEIFVRIGKKSLLLLILISISGAALASLVTPQNHRVYYDEDIYSSIGQCIAHHKRAVMCNEGYHEHGEFKIVAEEYNKQPAAYPYLISIIYRIFGTNELFIFIFNNIIFALSAIVIFLISFLFFESIFAGLIASLSYIFIPVNLQWFNTCAIEPSTTFFASLSVLALLIYIRNKKPINLFFFICALAFSFNFRPESLLIVTVVGLILLLKDIKIFARKELYFFGVLLFLLSLGIVVHLYAMQGNNWGATGAKFSMEYFNRNFGTNTAFYFNNKGFPVVFSILAIIGLLFYKSKVYVKEKVILLSWFLAFWGIFLFFYAGTYEHDLGLSTRFSILSYVPISICIGLGASLIKNLLIVRVKYIKQILVILIIFGASSFLPFVRSQSKAESAACRMDHKYAMEFVKQLPEDSIIFTHNPSMFLINKRSAIQTSSETYNPGTVKRCLMQFRGGVYVHFNYWSGVSYDQLQRSFTQNILDRYDYEILEEHYYKNYKYGLYKITDLKMRKVIERK